MAPTSPLGLVALLIGNAAGHGSLTNPPSRAGQTMEYAGECPGMGCPRQLDLLLVQVVVMLQQMAPAIGTIRDANLVVLNATSSVVMQRLLSACVVQRARAKLWSPP